MRVVAVDIDLGEDREGRPEASAELGDLLVRSRLLASELVAVGQPGE